DGRISTQDRRDRRFGLVLLVANELRRARPDRGVQRGALAARVGEGSEVRAAAGALLVQRLAESLDIDRDPGIGRQLDGQVDREAVGIVQPERFGAGDLLVFRLRCLLEKRIEPVHAGRQGATERLFLVLQRTQDYAAALAQLGILVTKVLDDNFSDLAKERPLDADRASLLNGAP